MTLHYFFNHQPVPREPKFAIVCNDRGELQRVVNYANVINGHMYIDTTELLTYKKAQFPILINDYGIPMTDTGAKFCQYLRINFSDLSDVKDNSIYYYIGYDENHYPMCVTVSEQDMEAYDCSAVRKCTEAEYENMRPTLEDMKVVGPLIW